MGANAWLGGKSCRTVRPVRLLLLLVRNTNPTFVRTSNKCRRTRLSSSIRKTPLCPGFSHNVVSRWRVELAICTFATQAAPAAHLFLDHEMTWTATTQWLRVLALGTGVTLA